MSSLVAAPATLSGSQRPRLESRPDCIGSHGDRVLAFLTACGLTLDEWQAYVIGALFDVNSDGLWAATEFGALVARQNGKGEILVGYDLAHLFLFPRTDLKRKTILHTAHEMKTAVDGFQRLAGVIESTPRLMQRVANIYTANGQEGIILKKRPGQILGDRIRFIARSKNSGRGFAADNVVYDEAQELGLQSHNALTYTQSQIVNRQELFTGTVPEEGINDSEVWEGLRDRGRAQKSTRTGWMEWTPTGSEDPDVAPSIDLGDEMVWAESNPSYRIRMPIESVVDQYERAITTNPEGFMRERLSIWPNRKQAEVVKLSDLEIGVWKEHADPEAAVAGDGVVFSLAVGRGGAYATIGKAMRFDSDTIAVEHHKTDRGTRWLADDFRALKAEQANFSLVLDPKNAAAVLSSLDKAGVDYTPMNLDEIAASHSLFIEHSNAGVVPHRDQPEVTLSLELATTRKLGRAGVTWEHSDPSKPISMAQAVTWAHWGVLKSESTSKPVPVPPPNAAILTRGDVENEPDLRGMAF